MPRKSEHSLAADPGDDGGFSRADRNAVDQQFHAIKRFQHLHRHIPGPHRTSAGDPHRVAEFQDFAGFFPHFFKVVFAQPQINGNGTRLKAESAQGVTVDVSNLSRSGFLMNRNNLVTCGDNTYLRFSINRDFLNAKTGKESDVLGSKDCPFFKNNLSLSKIVTLSDDIFQGRHRAAHFNSLFVYAVAVFQHHHRIRTVGYHAACRYLHGFPGNNPAIRFFSHNHFAGKIQKSRKTVRRAESVLRPDSITIHRRPRKPGHVFLGNNLFGQDTVEGFRNGDGFHPHRFKAF